MYDNISFGTWQKLRRKELDMTREELAQKIGCSPIMIYKIEAGERRPSKQIATLLARELKILDNDVDTFIRFARHSDGANVHADRPIKGIPSFISPLIGRETDLMKLENMLLLDKERLITLVGIPGVGKTSLAAQILLNTADRFDDESYFVSLISIRDPEEVASAIAISLDLKEISGQSPIDQIKHFFANRMSLLVLDNFEHLLKNKAMITELCEACPRLQIIVTSRAALKVPNEVIFRVKTLKTPDVKQVINPSRLREYASVELFVQAARASQPNFALTFDNAPAVAQICARLEGIPLAIVFAAARIKMFSPERLLQQLEKRLSTVTSSTTPAPSHHKTLRSALEWSYDLLNPAQQQLLAKLAVFVNGSTFEAIEHICRDADEDVLSPLEVLVEQNLVQEMQDAAGHTRFYLLETVREYALERLNDMSAYQVDALRRAHTAYYLSLAEQAEPQLRGKDQLAWFGRLSADEDNFEVVLEWSQQYDAEINLRLAGALAWFWFIRGRLQRASHWLKIATLNADYLPARYRANAYFYISAIGTITAEFQWALDGSTEAIRLFRELGDDRMVGQALVGHITNRVSLGNFDKLDELLREGTELAQRSDDKHTLAAYGLHLGFLQPDPQIKAQILERYLPPMRDTGDRWILNTALIELGQTYVSIGNYERAETVLRESLRSCQELGDIRQSGWTLGALGEALFYMGDHTAAIQSIIDALRIARDINDPEGIAVRLTQMARVFHAIEHHDFAIHLLGSVSNLSGSGPQILRDVHISRYTKTLELVRSALTPNAFSASWYAGKIMKPEQAAEYALSYAIFVANLV